MMVLIFAIPFVFFVCVAVVQAMRTHWQNVLSAALAAALSLAMMACVGQLHENAILRARLHYFEGKAKELQRQIKSQNGTSDQAVPAIGAIAPQHDD
jgi:membrane protein implicated in regulation of membrane protease activity